MTPVWLAWSSGKDAAWTLETLLDASDLQVVGLFTMLDEGTGRVPFQGTGRDLLELQAAATGLPLHAVELPSDASNDQYDLAFTSLVAAARGAGVSTFVYGDLFLTDLRDYREKLHVRHETTCRFPLWRADTGALARTMVDGGLEAIITCVDPTKIDPRWLGAPFDHAFLDALPADVDPCGENGEFHTFVNGGPMLIESIDVGVGEVFEERGFRCVEPVVRLEIDGTLDLHGIPPKQVGDLVDDYLDEARQQGVLQVRIVHGKGIGALRDTVHARLRRRGDVAHFALGGEGAGGWGATLVRLAPSD